MSISDDIGSRGEALFFVLITQFCGRSRPLFRPHFLGDKFTTLDYLVELLDPRSHTPFFFVQVKTTAQGYTKGSRQNRRLKVQVSHQDMERLIHYPAPTYLIGIDEREEIGYIVSANAGSPRRFASVPTSFPLNCQNLLLLAEEVTTFWEQRDMTLTNSAFTVRDREKQG